VSRIRWFLKFYFLVTYTRESANKGKKAFFGKIFYGDQNKLDRLSMNLAGHKLFGKK